MKIQVRSNQPRSRSFLPLVCAGLLALAAAGALAGCAHFQAWGQGGSNQHTTAGGAFNIPFGK